MYRKSPLTGLITFILLLITINSFAQNKITRNDLLDAGISERIISSVKSVEIAFPPGQKGPYHKHSCPVIGYVVSGSILFKVEGEPKQILKAGDVFLEPEEIPIVHFDNNSEADSARFVAFYLTDGEENLIQMLQNETRNR